jgi:hypothetical protein
MEKKFNNSVNEMNLNHTITVCLVLLLTCKPILTSEADTVQPTDASGDTSTEANPVDGDKKPETDSGVVKCAKKVLENLGLEGLDNASDTDMVMCPSVKSTCCTVKDQLVINETWIAGKAKENLQAKFDVHLKVNLWFIYKKAC